MSIDTLTLENGTLRATVAPALGGSLLSFQRKVGPLWVDIFLNATNSHTKGRRAYFAMLPWTARMRHKSFPWDRATGTIPTQPPAAPNFTVNADWHPHAIHGYGPKLPWKVKQLTPTSVVLTLASADHPGFVYPSALELTLTYRIEGETLNVSSSVQNVGSESTVVSGGSHPFIPKYLAGCIAPPKLQFNATCWYPPRPDEPTEAMPQGHTEALPDDLNFAVARAATEVWDCTVGGWDGTASALWEEAGVQLFVSDTSMEESGLLHLWYAREKGTFAFEPVIGVGDTFNTQSRFGLSGARILTPTDVSSFSHDYLVKLIT